MYNFRTSVILFIFLFAHFFQVNSQTVITSITSEYENGQVFLTWDEENVTDSTRFNVYLSSGPINDANISQATMVGHHIEPSSGCDWWKNPASFSASESEDKTHGFRLSNRILDPTTGLFVHTVVQDDPGSIYFAVTYSSGKDEFDSIVPGQNSLLIPVSKEIMMPLPIVQGDVPLPGTAKGKSLIFKLHGRGSDAGISSNSNFLFFGDSTMGWREGLARKFYVEETDVSIDIYPYDRIWIGRPLFFSRDERDHVPAINSWWYGCNNKIYDEELSKEGVMVNYTEDFILYLIDWAQKYYETDTQRVYLEGTSMGGAGGIALGFHHPGAFARIKSNVPIVAYTEKAGSDGRSSLYRLDGICGREADNTILTDNGDVFIDYMNEEKTLREFSGELPFLVLCNGRNDVSIPWINNPSFYEALDETNRGYACYWDDGDHDMHVNLPQDFVDMYEDLPEFRKGSSYPAFSNFSNNKNPGNGDQSEGDITGWMNRGVYWSNVRETEDSWIVTVYTKGDFLAYPATVDIIPRGLHLFHVEKNTNYYVDHNGSETTVQSNDSGIIIIEDVSFNSPSEVLDVRIAKTTTKISDITKKDNIRIYPNPVKDNLYIDTSEYRSPISNISVFSYSGALIYRNVISADQTIIDTGSFPEGIYILKVESKEKVSSSRFVVIR